MYDAQFPEKLQPLFQPKRYKVLWGGRGAGRSWGVARALLIIGTQRPVRILCAREFQNSISESVHKVLADQIRLMGLERGAPGGGFYEIQKQGIYGLNGTTFSFEGIKNNTTRIKSYEGVDYCWVEEAVKVSKASWDILIPTIRKEGSEIWLTFNPELEEDETYKRFVKNARPEDSFVIHMNFRDNPWLSGSMKREIETAQEGDPDDFHVIWEGYPQRTVSGAVYAKEIRALDLEKRVLTVPWDRDFAVSTWWDLGRSDKTTIWFAQKVAMQYRILAYYENRFEDVLHYVKELQSRMYTYDTFWLPHDGAAKRLGMKNTIQEQLQSYFPNAQVKIVPRQSISDGINAARLVFPNCYFDEEECEVGIGHLRRYKYEVKDGQFSREPKHDDASHAADAFRYLALTIRASGQRQGRGVLERLAAARAAFVAGREKSPVANSWMGN